MGQQEGYGIWQEIDSRSERWPLSRKDLARFPALGLTEVRFEDYVDEEDPPVRRFRVEYRA